MSGQPQTFTEKCTTCVFRPGNLMKLRKGRLRELADPNAHLTCHQTISYGSHPEIGETLCRGYYDTIGERNNYIRVMHRIGGFKEVEPPK